MLKYKKGKEGFRNVLFVQVSGIKGFKSVKVPTKR